LSNSIASMEEKFGAEIFFWPWFLWFSPRKGPWTPATSDKSWRSRMVMGAMLDTPWRVGYTGYTYLYTFYLECGTSKKTRKNVNMWKKTVYIYIVIYSYIYLSTSGWIYIRETQVNPVPKGKDEPMNWDGFSWTNQHH
jgi:hypothetical protein